MSSILDKAPIILAHAANYNQHKRQLSSIQYIVIHYTGNVNDTAYNNIKYFKNNPVQSSAHFFVNDQNVYQSVPLDHAAYAVGLGGRTKPYDPNAIMWKKITNSNSVSIELCGSKDSTEATETTKSVAAQLTAELLKKLNLTPDRVYRHYDVTGKVCPAWAVNDPLKWLAFNLSVSNFYHYGEDGEVLIDNQENYEVFKRFMDRYLRELRDQPADWEAEAMNYCAARGLITNGRPKSYVTRGEMATILKRLNA